MANSVAIITTGGTIASRYDPATRRHIACDDGESLLEVLPHRAAAVDIRVENFVRIHSFDLSFDLVLGLAGRLRERLADDDVVGAVLTQGTDTLEESAYLLDLIAEVDKPVVMTGAQLPADHPQSDGPRNVADSISAAASPELVGLGVTVCFDGQIHAARDVTKLHTSAVETFTSLDYGCLGIVDEGHVAVRRRATVRRRYAVEALGARVPLIRLAMDADTTLIDAAVAAGVEGIVVEAFGRGNVTTAYAARIGEAVERGIPVVVTSRCALGRVKPIYGTGGGGRELEDLGVIFAGDLKGPKARLLLLVLLSGGRTLEEIRQEFALNAP